MDDFSSDSDGIAPRTGGMLLALIALLGIGLYAVSVLVDYKSADPLYDRDNMSTHTPSALMETQDLWKKKQPPAERVPQASPRATSQPGS